MLDKSDQYLAHNFDALGILDAAVGKVRRDVESVLCSQQALFSLVQAIMLLTMASTKCFPLFLSPTCIIKLPISYGWDPNVLVFNGFPFALKSLSGTLL